jgi:protein-S-isoprenylcysteine O-methyltransferase Ste14
MNFILLVVAASSFAIYAWAIRVLFSHDAGVDRRMQLIQVLGSLFAIAQLWSLWSAPRAVTIRGIAALMVYVAALAVFLAAKRALRDYRLSLAFSPDAPARIVESGVYGYVRHPFYLAYMMTWAAGALAAPQLMTYAACLLMGTLYFSAARFEERKFAQSALAAEYQRYRQRVGMCLPRRPLTAASVTNAAAKTR